VVICERHERDTQVPEIVEHLGARAVEEHIVTRTLTLTLGPRYRDLEIREDGVRFAENWRDRTERHIEVLARVVLD
jgi:hypothetical protein